MFGDWDPSLAVVMDVAFAVTAVGYRLAGRRSRPVLSGRVYMPRGRGIDRRLAVGVLLFGVGWGLAGLCPGPAVAAVTIGGVNSLLFLLAMMIGIYAFDRTPTSALRKL